ncbi:hypothetical protein FACS1894219_09670 [Clostridia bacterium]|nr:hypothetical protein FACS1894219_09670 [Clostridia bacterium]
MFGLAISNNSNDNEEFKKFCDNHYEDLKKYVYHEMSNNLTYADDIVQNVFIVAIMNKDAVLNHANPLGWLFVTAKNLCQSHYRENAVQIKSEEELIESNAVYDQQLPSELCDDLIATIESQLSDKELRLFREHYLDGMTLKTIAGNAGLNYENLKRYSSRLRKKLISIINSHDAQK